MMELYQAFVADECSALTLAIDMKQSTPPIIHKVEAIYQLVDEHQRWASLSHEPQGSTDGE